MTEDLATLLMVTTYLVYIYLACGVVFATLVYLGLVSRDKLRWHDLDLIDPQFRIKAYLLLIVNWYNIVRRL